MACSSSAAILSPSSSGYHADSSADSDEESLHTICYICHMPPKEKIPYGPFMRPHWAAGVGVHYFCLMLSHGLVQNGHELSDFAGFRLKDIRATATKARNKFCHYCSRPQASLHCEEPGCRRRFHMICAVDNNCRLRFDTFSARCDEHHCMSHGRPHAPEQECAICLDPMGVYNPVTSIRPRVCCPGQWYHRRCLSKAMLHAGFYANCPRPQCGNRDLFVPLVRSVGVFVPEREATWELDGGFQDLERSKLLTTYDMDRGGFLQEDPAAEPESCDFAKCIHKRGGRNDIVTCVECRVRWTHVKCFLYHRSLKEWQLPETRKDYYCRDCVSKSCLAVI